MPAVSAEGGATRTAVPCTSASRPAPPAPGAAFRAAASDANRNASSSARSPSTVMAKIRGRSPAKSSK
jgi:hypothetical protein